MPYSSESRTVLQSTSCRYAVLLYFIFCLQYYIFTDLHYTTTIAVDTLINSIYFSSTTSQIGVING
nr:MAG TPA: hypothetical protein [Caudoviricetes sp.]